MSREEVAETEEDVEEWDEDDDEDENDVCSNPEDSGLLRW